MYYKIEEKMESCGREALGEAGVPFVAVLTPAEWAEQMESFDMGIELEISTEHIRSTKVEVNYDSLTGTFLIPDREDLSGEKSRFAFVLDEKGIVFIDESDAAERIVESIRRSKRLKNPGLERFLYEFLERIIHDDQEVAARYDEELDSIESAILEGSEENFLQRISEIRSDLRDLRIHYSQLLDLIQELEENENGFFREENIRYFRLFRQRLQTLLDMAANLAEYTVQVRELYGSQLDLRQNRIMTILTVVTSIFMPLTLITGWYGMNFVYMPELKWRFGYLMVAVISLCVASGCLLFFRKKKWL
ncbi:MAG: magnesium transporter CorA [Eubacterium sp.]|nr:magnesium transporter CorA [Eubacterium sp.]